MNITELKKHLKDATKEELLKDIVDIYKKNEFVKDYYVSKYSADSRSLVLAKYKEIIEYEFFPEKGFGKARLSVAKKSITEFKKISNDKTSIAELMIFYVENGVNYTECYGDIDQQFYHSMENMYERLLKFIVDNGLVDVFNDRCLKIVSDTQNMGWGFHEQLCEIYYDYIGE